MELNKYKSMRMLLSMVSITEKIFEVMEKNELSLDEAVEISRQAVANIQDEMQRQNGLQK